MQLFGTPGVLCSKEPDQWDMSAFFFILYTFSHEILNSLSHCIKVFISSSFRFLLHLNLSHKSLILLHLFPSSLPRCHFPRFVSLHCYFLVNSLQSFSLLTLPTLLPPTNSVALSLSWISACVSMYLLFSLQLFPVQHYYLCFTSNTLIWFKSVYIPQCYTASPSPADSHHTSTNSQPLLLFTRTSLVSHSLMLLHMPAVLLHRLLGPACATDYAPFVALPHDNSAS